MACATSYTVLYMDLVSGSALTGFSLLLSGECCWSVDENPLIRAGIECEFRVRLKSVTFFMVREGT